MMGVKLRRVAVAAVVVCILPGVLNVAGAGTSGAAQFDGGRTAVAQQVAEPIRVLQWNTRGIIRNGGTNPDPDIDPNRLTLMVILAGMIRIHRPAIVTLNEVCEGQVELLKGLLRLPDFNHPMESRFFTDSNDERCLEVHGQLSGAGRAILTIGAPIHLPSPSPNAGCVIWQHEWAEELSTSIDVCVVHISPEVAPEVGQSMSAWAERPASPPVIVAGDFNATPISPEMDWTYSSAFPIQPGQPPGRGRFWEADMCVPVPPTDPECSLPVRGGAVTAGHRKIDYVFADDLHFGQWASATVVDTAGLCNNGLDCSDHKMVVGEFHLLGSARTAGG
jgi:hypothetical protein